jgi:hypothetical protein
MSEPDTSSRTRPQRIAERLARSVFLPSGLRYESVVPLSQALIVLLFGCLVVLVCPPVTQYVLQHVVPTWAKEFAKNNTEPLKRWLEFTQTCFEFLTQGIARAESGVEDRQRWQGL